VRTIIGKKAYDLLAQDNRATLAGVTSRGAFLRFPSGWTIFLSTERYRGPLSINLIEGEEALSVLEPGQAAWITPSAISFPASAINLSICQVGVWQAPLRTGKILPVEDLSSRSKSRLRLALESDVDHDLRELITAFLDNKPSGSTRFEEIRQALQRISIAWKQHDVRSIPEVAGTLFGFGTGLTPWGDDLILGMLLAMNRWGDMIYGDIELSPLNRVLVRDAWARTTNLSASLIECAAEGQADERLLLALDGLVRGEPGLGALLEALLIWGNSSGLAVLCGMALVLV